MSEENDMKALRRFYEFDDEDLEANRQDRLSPKQSAEIEARNRNLRYLGNGIAIGAGAVMLIIVCVLGLAIAMWLGSNDWNGADAGLPAGIGGLIVLAGVGYYFRRRLLTKANRPYVVRSLTGPVHVSSMNVDGSRGRSYKEYHMEIQGVTFVLDDEIRHRIKDGEMHTFHYVDWQDGSEGMILPVE